MASVCEIKVYIYIYIYNQNNYEDNIFVNTMEDIIGRLEWY